MLRAGRGLSIAEARPTKSGPADRHPTRGSSTTQAAKIRTAARSQFVRLPKEFHFACEKVRIRREGATVILEPIPADWSWLDDIVGPFDEDFVQAALEPVSEQSRPELNKLA